MRKLCRVGDDAYCPAESHGGSSREVQGPAVKGSPNVFINGIPVLRVGDTGVHQAKTCSGPNTWVNIEGSSKVFINNIPAVRLGDRTRHCGGQEGVMIEAADNIFVD